jgi:iron complex outermembrane receptor protein
MRLRRALTSLVYGVSLSAYSAVSSASHLDIPAGDLTSALELLARQAHVEFIYSAEDLQGLHTRGVNGDLTAEAALRKLIEGTGLTMSVHSSGAILIARNQLVDHPPGPPRAPAKPLHTATPPAPQGYQTGSLEEIVVTASMRAEPLYQVAGAVSAISGAQLDEQGANGLADYVGFLPGVGMQSFGHSGYDTVFIRGIATQNVGAATATYIDEVPVGDASAITRGGLFTVDLDPTDLERVEVLKGPQGALYGASSMGGVIKYVTRAPDLTRAELHLYEDAGLIEGGSTATKLGVTASMPLIEGQLGVRISGYYRHSGGFIDDLGVGGSDTNRANDRGVRATLLYRPVDNLTLKVTAMEQDDQAHGNDVVDYDLNTGRPVIGADAQYRYLSEPSKIRLQLYAAEVKYQLQHLEIVSATSYSSLRPVTIYDLTDSLTGLGLTGLPADARAASVYTEPVTKINQELRFVAARRGRLEWMLGAFFQRESADGSYIDRFYGNDEQPVSGIPLEQTYRVGSLTEAAGFGNLTLFLIPGFDITAGFRHSNLDQTLTRNARGVLNDPGDPSTYSFTHQRFTETPDTYLATARWRPTDDFTVYGRAASGYRPGGGRPAPPAAPANFPDYYTSDSLWSYEAGLKIRALEHRLSLDLAGFWINWTHIQAEQPVGDFTVDGNAGSATSRGVEIQTQFVPRDGWMFGANGALTVARFTQSIPLDAITAGEPLYYVPKWTTTAFSSYSRSVGNGWRLQTAGDFQYQSQRLDINRISLPAYALGNARVAVNNDRYRVTLYVKNIANKQALLGYGGAGFVSPYGFVVNPPRTVGIGFAENF